MGRRLTSAEFANAIDDLFGPALAAATAPLTGGEPAVGGFRNDISVSLIDSATVEELRHVAAKVAAAVPAAELTRWSDGCTKGPAVCGELFVRNLGRRLYRRPLTAEDLANVMPLFAATTAEAQPFERGARLAMEVMLQAPSFLYRLETARPEGPTSHEKAARLSFLVWASLPGPALLDAADRGELTDADSLRRQLDALLSDPRARRGWRVFADEWLGLYRNITVRRPRPDLGLTATLMADMRAESLEFVERLAFTPGTDLMTLFTDRTTRVTPELAGVYGVRIPSAAVLDLAKVPNRIGILTQPAFLGVNAGEAQASIVDRAMAVREHLLCLPVLSTPPGLDVTSVFAGTDATLSERDRFAQHRTDPACVACHQQIDPFGYAFEVFDLVGRLRTTDTHGNSLRGDGELELDGKRSPYADAVEMARLLAASPTASSCLSQRFVRYALGRVVGADETAHPAVHKAFERGGRTYAALLAGMVGSAAFVAPGVDVRTR